MTVRFISYVLAACFILFPVVVHSQIRNREKAKAHYEAAEKHYQKAEFRRALEEYLKVLDFIERDSIPEMYFNIAQCHRQLAEVEKALFYYRLFLSKSPTSPLRPEVERHVQSLEAERQKTQRPKGKVTIITEPPGALILIDTFEGDGEGVSPRVLEIDAGTHILVLRKEGFKDVTHQLEVEADKMVVIQHKLEKSGDSGVQTQDAKSLLGDRGDESDPPRGVTPVPGSKPLVGNWWFWAGVGGTVAFVGASAFFGYRALSLKSDWDKDPSNSQLKKDGENARLFSDVFLGAALVTGGLTLWKILTYDAGSPSPVESTGSAFLFPSCGTEGCGMVLQFRF